MEGIATASRCSRALELMDGRVDDAAGRGGPLDEGARCSSAGWASRGAPGRGVLAGGCWPIRTAPAPSCVIIGSNVARCPATRGPSTADRRLVTRMMARRGPGPGLASIRPRGDSDRPMDRDLTLTSARSTAPASCGPPRDRRRADRHPARHGGDRSGDPSAWCALRRVCSPSPAGPPRDHAGRPRCWWGPSSRGHPHRPRRRSGRCVGPVHRHRGPAVVQAGLILGVAACSGAGWGWGPRRSGCGWVRDRRRASCLRSAGRGRLWRSRAWWRSRRSSAGSGSWRPSRRSCRRCCSRSPTARWRRSPTAAC